MKNSIILKAIGIIVFTLFLSLYFSKYNNQYYENKSTLTEEAIAQYEKDLKEGKEILSNNYIEEEKNYNNKISKIGMKTSQFIEKAFDKGLHYLMKYLEQMQE